MKLRTLATMILLWAYFIGAFAAGYWIVFFAAGLLRGRRGLSWALGNYARSFFVIVRLAIPRVRLELPEREQLRCVHGNVVVSNHLSFLDPLLLLSLLPNVITIVRPDFFRVPFFGWLLRGAGFLGPDLFTEGPSWIAKVERHLRSGGNLLIFPEGTRSRDGQLAPFKKGAFYLAKHLAAPISVLRICGTSGLFPPGRFSFDVCATQPIEVRQLAVIAVAEAANNTTQELTARVRAMLSGHPA